VDSQHSFSPALFFQIAHTRPQQIFQRNNPCQLAPAVYHRHARNACFRHAVNHNAEWFVRVRDHRILTHDAGELARTAVTSKLVQLSPRHHTH